MVNVDQESQGGGVSTLVLRGLPPHHHPFSVFLGSPELHFRGIPGGLKSPE